MLEQLPREVVDDQGWKVFKVRLGRAAEQCAAVGGVPACSRDFGLGIFEDLFQPKQFCESG